MPGDLPPLRREPIVLVPEDIFDDPREQPPEPFVVGNDEPESVVEKLDRRLLDHVARLEHPPEPGSEPLAHAPLDPVKVTLEKGVEPGLLSPVADPPAPPEQQLPSLIGHTHHRIVNLLQTPVVELPRRTG